jgi:hypothetical protein
MRSFPSRPAVAAAAIVAASTALAHARVRAGGAAAKIDPADTAFLLSATGLVLMMSIPGLALFYAGMVRKKNVLATMAQSHRHVALARSCGSRSATAWRSPARAADRHVRARAARRHDDGDRSPLAKTVPESCS